MVGIFCKLARILLVQILIRNIINSREQLDPVYESFPNSTDDLTSTDPTDSPHDEKLQM